MKDPGHPYSRTVSGQDAPPIIGSIHSIPIADISPMPRLQRLIDQYPGHLWFSDQHRNRMECLNYELGFAHKRNNPRYYAAMFLLTSNLPLHTRTQGHYSYQGIDFRGVSMKGISPRNYTLFQTARRLHSGEIRINSFDVSNPDIVDDKVLQAEYKFIDGREKSRVFRISGRS